MNVPHRRIRFVLLFLAVAGLIGWVLLHDNAEFLNDPGMIPKPSLSHGPSLQQSSIPSPEDSLVRSPDQEPLKFLSSKELLDQLCPPLIPEEENSYLERYGRTPASLIGLLQIGSPDGRHYLREALENFPEDPLVQYSALEWGHPDLNLTVCAEVLWKHFPSDSLPRQIMIKKRLQEGDLGGAIAYMEPNLEQESTTILFREIQELKNKVWSQNGRTTSQYDSRRALECKSLPQLTILQEIASLLRTQFHFKEITEESKVALPYLFWSFGAFVGSSEINAADHVAAIMGEIDALSRLADIAGHDSPSKWFPMPLENMLQQADAERLNMEKLQKFASQMTQIYQRLPEEEQASFVVVSNAEGQQKALEWLLAKRPQFYAEFNFPPQDTPISE